VTAAEGKVIAMPTKFAPFFYDTTGGNYLTASSVVGATMDVKEFVITPLTFAEEGVEWEGVLGMEGHPTSDGRYLLPGEIGNRDLPLPLMAQFETEEGHKGAKVAGKITRLWREDRPDIGPNAVAIMGAGLFDSGEVGQEAARLVDDEVLRGVSLDLPAEKIVAIDPDTMEEVSEEDVDFGTLLTGGYLTGIAGKIAAVTIVPVPAFEEASIAVTDGQAVVASAYGLKVKRDVLTASAAGQAPLKPPLDWFFIPEPNEPTPLTVTDDGRVYGHLALWNQCHAGFASCELAPRSRTSYAYFHVGEIQTADGEYLPVGRITVGQGGQAKGGHASLVLGRKGAMEHYDATGCVGAFVRASDGRHGIWLSGAVRSDVAAERVRDLRANPPSGDWRDGELVAVLSVPVPGFPIPRSELRMVASGAHEEVTALIASGYVPTPLDQGRRLKLRSLRHRALRV
jgi:hypothetical protein